MDQTADEQLHARSLSFEELIRAYDALRAENRLARTTIDAQSKAVIQLSAENDRLRAEIGWLRDELCTTQETLTACLESA